MILWLPFGGWKRILIRRINEKYPTVGVQNNIEHLTLLPFINTFFVPYTLFIVCHDYRKLGLLLMSLFTKY